MRKITAPVTKAAKVAAYGMSRGSRMPVTCARSVAATGSLVASQEVCSLMAQNSGQPNWIWLSLRNVNFGMARFLVAGPLRTRPSGS